MSEFNFKEIHFGKNTEIELSISHWYCTPMGKEMQMSNEEMVEHLRNRYLEPDPDPEPLEHCDYCGEGLYEGDMVWKIGEDLLCDDCAHEHYAEVLQG